jgi:hypothetical protein
MEEVNPPTIDHLTWENSDAVVSCFISEAATFANNRTRGVGHLSQYNFLGRDIIKTPEIICRDTPELKKFKGKKILVVGAGPTTNWHDWKPNEYDHIFSCNHFFLNKKLSNCKVDLILLCGEVDLTREDFLEYIKNNNTIIGFEDYNKGPNNIKELKNKIDNPIFDCVLRFQGKIGVAPKLIILATLLGAAEVDYVGIDGTPKKYSIGAESKHSFQKGKRWTTNYPYKLTMSHYRCLNNYLKQIGEKTKLKNLGAGHEYNAMSKIQANS